MTPEPRRTAATILASILSRMAQIDCNSDLYRELSDLVEQHNRGTWNRKDPLLAEAERLAEFQR